MEPYVGRRRPLLLFASTGTDPHLRAMRADLAARGDGFEDRDMVLVEVIPDAPRAGSRGLTEGQAAELRRQYRVEPDEFAVILVGKDGGIKLRDDKPVPVEAIFQLIDQMPMRRQEMGEP